MSIKTGRFGQVLWDAAPASPENPTVVGALNAWKLSMAATYEDVTCFQASNKVYIPDLPDVSGTLGGFWDSTITVLFDAVKAGTPGFLRLFPNTGDAASIFEGLAYMDASVDCSMKTPKVTGTFHAAGPWITP